MNVIVYRRLRKRKTSNVILLIASFALLIFLEALILMFFGAEVKTIGYIEKKILRIRLSGLFEVYVR